MSSILQQIQSDCAGALLADPWFANVPVLTQILQDPGSELDQALNNLGVCVTLVVPVATVAHPNQPGPYFERIRIVARVVENVIVNQNIGAGGTGKGALEVAEHVCALLHHFRPQNLSETVVCDNPTITLERDHERLAYDAAFTTQGGLAWLLPQFDAPSVSQSGRSVAIAAATNSSMPVPGAAIFYTLDGTFPGPRNGALYMSPISVATGQTLRAVALLAGYLPANSTLVCS
jgi:hypothetical protein